MKHPKTISKFSKVFLSISCFCGVVLTCSTGHAQTTRTWTGGGAGNWQGAPNWGGVAPVPGDSLVFSGTLRLSSTNNFSGGTNFGSITFASDAGAFELTGNGFALAGDITNNSDKVQTLTNFSGNGVVIQAGNRTFRAATGDLLFNTTVSVGSNILITEAAAGRTVTINGPIQTGSGLPGGGGLQVSGEGTTVLGGTNTYTGATTLTSGTLSISSANNLQSTSSVIFANASQGTLHASETVDLGKNITQTGAGSYGAASGKTLTLSGTVSGAGDLNVNGEGTVVLTATNSYTGSTQLTSGTLLIGSIDAIESSSSVVFAAGSQGVLHVSETVDLGKNITQTGAGSYGAASGKILTLSGTVSGAGDLNVNGEGTVVLTATNSYTGSTQLTSGTLSISSVDAIQSSSSVVFAAGSQGVLYVSETLNLDKNITQTGSGDYSVAAGKTLALSGVISGAGELNVSGPGSILLTASNTFTGATRLKSGTLSIGSASTIESSSSIVFESDAQATLNVTQSISLSRNILQSGTGIYVIGTGNTLALGGAISGGGNFVMQGGGNVALTGTNTFTGSTTITSGTLSVDSGDSLQSTSSLIFASGNNSTLHITGNNVNLTRNIDHVGVGNYEVTVGKTLTLSGTLSGAGDLNLKGNGRLALTGTNTFTGATLINTGTVAINSAANLQSTSSISFVSGTSASLHATVDGINLNKSISQVGRANYYVDSGNTFTLSGTISGVGQFQKHGEGLIVLDAANTYSGRTVVNSGTLRLGASGSIVNANMDIAGGVFDLNGKNLTLTNTLTLGTTAGSSGTILSTSTPSSFSVAGEILVRSGTIAVNLAGSASLKKTESGTVVLSGSNNYSGTTSVEGGLLVVDGRINSNVTVSGSGALGGSGTVNGSVTVKTGAALRPGNSPGILTTGDFTLELGGKLGVEISGLLPGFGGYDVVTVNGAVVLQGNLEVTLDMEPLNGSQFFIIRNDGSDAITGTFDGLAQGEILWVGAQAFRIYYDADSDGDTLSGGNDVALLAVPEPGTWALMGLGGAYLMFRRRSRKAA